MITKRIIPCLDVRNGRVVKGVNFKGISDVADPVELADLYSKSGADELVFYDITASFEERTIFTDILKKTAERVFIPLTVGGGINTLDDFARVAKRYGDQCVVLSVDAKRVDGEFRVFAKGGREDTGIEAVGWIKRLTGEGAGEVVLNSIDTDGVRRGFDLEMLRAVSEAVNVPVIASGGAGCADDFIELFKTLPRVDAGLAAGIFHFGEVTIPELKKELKRNGVNVRC